MKYLGGKAATGCNWPSVSSMMPARLDAANDPAWEARATHGLCQAHRHRRRRGAPIRRSLRTGSALETVYTKHLGQLAELAVGRRRAVPSVPAMKALVAKER